MRKIFYYYKGVKVEVKPLPEKTIFSFKFGPRDLFNIELGLEDTEISRRAINHYIDILRSH